MEKPKSYKWITELDKDSSIYLFNEISHLYEMCCKPIPLLKRMAEEAPLMENMSNTCYCLIKNLKEEAGTISLTFEAFGCPVDNCKWAINIEIHLTEHLRILSDIKKGMSTYSISDFAKGLLVYIENLREFVKQKVNAFRQLSQKLTLEEKHMDGAARIALFSAIVSILCTAGFFLLCILT